jgi:YVTN family beta-propeller protein
VSTIALGRSADTVALDPDAERAVVGGAGTVSVLDLAPAHLLYRVAVGDPGTLAPPALALDPTTHHLFVADRARTDAPGAVQMLDSRSGRRLATVRVGHEPGALAVDTRRGHVFVANLGEGTVSLLDARSGALLRTTPVGLVSQALAIDERTARLFVIGLAGTVDSAQPAWSEGRRAGLLGLLDTRTGALLQRTQVGSGPDALAVDERSARVFVASSTAGTLSVLDARSGTLLRTVTLGGRPSALAVDERRRRVYVADAGTLSVLDATSGALVRTVRVEPTPRLVYALSYALAVDAARDRVYLSTDGPVVQGPSGPTLQGDGTLYILDARTGAVRGRIAVGVAPQALAVAASSGRVVVANGGGAVLRAPADWGALWLGRLRQWLPWLGRGAAPQPTTARVPGSVSLIDGAP